MNKPFSEMNLMELHSEYDHWSKELCSGSQWGGAPSVAYRFQEECSNWIRIRENETREQCSESQGSTSS